MKYIKLKSKNNNQDWSKVFADKDCYDVIYDEDVFITKPDGTPLMVLLKKVIPTDINARAWSVLKKYREESTNRGSASGISTAPRKKMDGTYSKVIKVPKGWEVFSGIIGFFERTSRFPACHACAWNSTYPEQFSHVLPLVEKVNELYKKWVPDRWKVQKKFADQTPKEYLVGDSVYTTLTVNKNFRTACHKDAGDLEEGFSCMTVIREGKYLGGDLVLPNWRVAAKLDTGDLIMFDAHEYHGNTQIIPLTKKYQRCSIVYYYRTKMQFCLPIEEEIKRVNNRKEGDPLYE